ncbi:MAG: capsular polysaccharide synthesis protein [Chitinispirillales bacterium]|jgi:hypothetical protein|nr:capsular polysaccharide synthesis protein [Chitinispirillales bacterium]
MNKFIFRLKTFLKGNTALRDAVRRVFAASDRNRRKKTMAYLKKRYGHIFEKYGNPAVPAESGANSAESTGGVEKYPVWFCWFQGEENMPPAVKICYASLLKNADGHKINFITFDNYREYAVLPDYIIEKHKENIIHNIQFSDIIRVFLLSRHGGLWVDATLYVSGGLPEFNGMPFWTPKWNNGCGGYASMLYFISLLYCRYPGNVLMCFLRDIFIDYWKNETKLIDYHLLSASIDCAYNNIAQVKGLIDAVSFAKRGCYDLYYRMNLQYDDGEYKSICEEIRFHKLTYKENFKEYTKNNELTFYGYLCREYGSLPN